MNHPIRIIVLALGMASVMPAQAASQQTKKAMTEERTAQENESTKSLSMAAAALAINEFVSVFENPNGEGRITKLGRFLANKECAPVTGVVTDYPVATLRECDIEAPTIHSLTPLYGFPTSGVEERTGSVCFAVKNPTQLGTVKLHQYYEEQVYGGVWGNTPARYFTSVVLPQRILIKRDATRGGMPRIEVERMVESGRLMTMKAGGVKEMSEYAMCRLVAHHFIIDVLKSNEADLKQAILKRADDKPYLDSLSDRVTADIDRLNCIGYMQFQQTPTPSINCGFFAIKEGAVFYEGMPTLTAESMAGIGGTHTVSNKEVSGKTKSTSREKSKSATVVK